MSLKRSSSFLSLRLLIGFILVPAFVGFVYLVSVSQPVNPATSQKVEFEIKPNQGIDQIAVKLEEAGLIRSQTSLKIHLALKGSAKKIQAGFFYLSPSQSTSEIASSLTKASSKQIWITLPEGLRRQEIAAIIFDSLEKAEVDHQFDPREFIELTAALEGQLYPDTYAFSPQISSQQAVSVLTGRFQEVISQSDFSAQDLHPIIILASLIEREAATDEERPEIAGILTNRLKSGWPLQVDASVQYVLASTRCADYLCQWWPRPLTKQNLQIDSPYNTYKYPGLPPGPISNPGLSSLKAAANPNQTNNWFYLHDPQGIVHYSSTVEQHNANVCTYLTKDCP